MTTHKAMRSCRLDDELYGKVKFLADAESRSFNNYLEALLKKHVADYEAIHGEIPFEPVGLGR